MRSPVSWSFKVSLNPVFWAISNANPTAYQGKEGHFTQSLKNVGDKAETFTINAYPDWLTPDPISGTIPSAGQQEINFTIDTQLNVGIYTDTVHVQTSKGIEYLFVTLEILREPPIWTVNAGSYSYSMNITMQAIISGAVSKDVFDMVAVFVDDECRGVANIEYVSAINTYEAFLTVYSNTVTGEKLTFRLWDASSGKTYAYLGGNYIFNSNSSLGTINTPLLIKSDAHIQDIELNTGWTWISLNLEQPDMSVKSVLKSLQPENGDVIKSQRAFSQYMSDIGWQGNLTQFETGESYCINVTNVQKLQYLGIPVDISKTSVPIDVGWNWIGYLQQDIKDVNEALASLHASGGDRIKSLTEFAEYLPATGTWEGSLKKLMPGQGYMLKSKTSADLVFPAIRKSQGSGGMQNLYFDQKPDWQVNVTDFEYNMSLTGSLEFDEKEMADSTLIVGAFINDECHGVGEIRQLPELSKYIVFLMVYDNSASGDSISFKVYEPATDKTRDVKKKVPFQSDQIIGNLAEPYILTVLPIGDELIPYTFYLRQNYPNPFNPATTIEYGLPRDDKVKLILYDLLGRKIKTVVDKSQKAGHYSVSINSRQLNLASGLYFYRIQAGNFIKTRKMLLVK